MPGLRLRLRVNAHVQYSSALPACCLRSFFKKSGRKGSESVSLFWLSILSMKSRNPALGVEDWQVLDLLVVISLKHPYTPASLSKDSHSSPL